MKIIQLRAENVKRLHAVEITPDGNVVVVSGKNGQGKSSVLDSIWFALGGGEAMKGTRNPVREGAKKAEVCLDLGDLKVTRSWTSDDKTYLKVEAADGSKFKSPQQVLDGIVGRFSFDPLEFIRQSEKEQVQTLLDLLNLPIDLPAMDKERARLYDQRTDVGRVVTKLEGQIAGMPEPAEDLPQEEISAASVMEAYRAALETERDNEAVVERFQQVGEQIATAEEDISTLKNRLLQRSIELAELQQEQEILLERIPGLPDPNPGQYKAHLADLEAVNVQIREAKKREAVAAELRTHNAAYNTLTRGIEEIDTAKKQALELAQMPVDGLGFDEHGVTYSNRPLKQASTSEQLRIGLAIAMTLNPTLRVVRINDGNVLDEDNMKLIAELAAAQDMQLWVERVGRDEGVGVYIEDGRVAETFKAAAKG